MLSLQYYNSHLTKAQLDKILNNYNLKYNTMKNEIDAKFNALIKVFLTDIKAFLENIEEITIKNLKNLYLQKTPKKYQQMNKQQQPPKKH